jgi:D-alanine-D-alanine ligase
VVHDLKELFARIDSVQSEFGQPVLVEQFIEGREFYVGVLGNMHAQALPPIEMDFSGLPAGMPRIASWDAKWGPEGTGTDAESAKSPEFAGTKSVFPSDLSEELCERLKTTAVQAFEALRLRDYARIDMRVDDAETIHVIEVNPNCYLEREAEFARAAEKDGMSYHKLIARILELAQARYAR